MNIEIEVRLWIVTNKVSMKNVVYERGSLYTDIKLSTGKRAESTSHRSKNLSLGSFLLAGNAFKTGYFLSTIADSHSKPSLADMR